MSIIPLSRAPADRAPGEEGALPREAPRYGADAASHRSPAPIPSREPVPPYDEAELARGLADGDPAALTEITRWLWEPLSAYAFRLLEDRDAAMDVAQEACMRLWERRGRDPLRCVRPWLFRTVRNLALDQLKTGRTRRGILQRYRPGRGRGPARPDEVFQRDRVAAEVQRAIQELPERRREVFALAYLQGLSYAEVAEVLGISPKTVQNQMSAALAQLRSTLRPLLDERRGGPCPPGGP